MIVLVNLPIATSDNSFLCVDLVYQLKSLLPPHISLPNIKRVQKEGKEKVPNDTRFLFRVGSK